MTKGVKKKSSSKNSKKKVKSETTVARESKKKARTLSKSAKEKTGDRSLSVGAFLKQLNNGREMPIMTSKQIQQYLTAIMLGHVKDGLTNMPAGIDDRLKAANHLHQMIKDEENKKNLQSQEGKEQDANDEIISMANRFNQGENVLPTYEEEIELRGDKRNGE